MSPRSSSVYAVVRSLVLTGLGCIILCGTALADRVEPGTVRGVVWNSDNAPVANANVRLRNLETGRIVASGETSTSGQFVFADVIRSSYLVELVSDSGKVLAVSHGFRLGSGETVSTVVRLPSRRSWYAGLFTNAGAAVIAAASTAGLTAIGSPAPPISPQ